MSRALTVVLVGLVLLVSGCSSDSGAEGKVASSGTEGKAALGGPNDPDESVRVPGCDRKTIGEESGPLAVAYGVVDGQIADTPCFGEPSDVVVSAWNELAAVTPLELIDAVTIVAGFDDEGGETLAYAAPVANDSDEHLIAVGMDSAVQDPQELRLTMAHELAHVFGQTPGQIDVAVFDDECDTFFNGFGCFAADAYVTAWVDQFWPSSVVDSLPDDHSVDIDGGDDRCTVDPAFPGSYAASHPEEDFAESFSAYVFDVELPAALEERLGFFDEYPEFVSMRDAVRAIDEPAPPNNFGRCG